MIKNTLSAREIQKQDLDALSSYWVNADHAFLRALGADPAKIPAKDVLMSMIAEQLSQSYEEKKAYCIIWLFDDKAIGHSNVNKIKFGEEAFMHLHIWQSECRTKGLGVELMKMSLPYFFKNLKLQKLFCEPYALNPAPNKALARAGFDFIKEYVTTPGWINFEQSVMLWEMSKEKFNALNKKN